MFSNAINKVRNFGYTMKQPLLRKIFFLYHFDKERYNEFCDFMYALNTEYQQGLYTKEQYNSALLAYWFHSLSNTHSCRKSIN